MGDIVLTGMGVVSTAGHTLEIFWDNLLRGHVTYKPLEEFTNNSNYRYCVGSKIEDMSWRDRVEKEYLNTYGRVSSYAISAASSAILDAGLTTEDIKSARIAVCIGTTMGEINAEERITELKYSKDFVDIDRVLLDSYNTENIGNAVRKALGLCGPVYVVPTACAAGNYAFALGKRLIEWEYADIAIVGGVDTFSRIAFTGFQRLLSLSPDLCRPFDKNRKGLIVGEGCGIVVLEKESTATARKARILGRLLGVGLTSDRYHMTAPHPEGDGAIRAMKRALEEAGLLSSDIDYISAHGTGTSVNDRIEVKAMEQVFGEDSIPVVSSIKSMLGHAMGAASALELIASIQMMHNDKILPTVNHVETDSELSIDCVPNIARDASIEFVMSNSFAFGGQVSSIVVKKG